MALDKLRFHNILVQEMDAPTESATKIADLVDEGIMEGMSELATKNDLEVMRLQFLSEMQGRFNSHLRWVMAMWGSAIAAIVALAVAIILRGG